MNIRQASRAAAARRTRSFTASLSRNEPYHYYLSRVTVPGGQYDPLELTLNSTQRIPKVKLFMAPSTSRNMRESGTARKDRETELELEIAQLKSRIVERDRTIFDLEEQIRGKDAIIVDKCQLIERLEQVHCDRLSPDQESVEETSQSTVHYVPSGILTAEQETQLLEELEKVRSSRMKLIQQNELLMQQWDEALAYVEQVQKKLQAELQHSKTLIDENAMLRKRITETVVISKSGVQFAALLFILLSLYLYSYS